MAPAPPPAWASPVWMRLNEAQRDGQIDGGQLLGVKLTDRFFMTDATLVASLEVTTPGGIDAGANFGFIGVNLGGDASLTADFTVGLKDPTATGAGHDGNISLTEFINGLSDFDSLLDDPSLTGLAQIHLDVTLDGDLPFVDFDSGTVDLAANLGDVLSRWDDSVDLSAATIDRGVDGTTFTLTGDFTDQFLRGARVTVPVTGEEDFKTFVANVEYDEVLDTTTVTVLDSAVLPDSLDDLTIGTPNTPIFDFDSDLGNLVSFNNPNFNFASIIEALLLVRDMLVEIDGDAVEGVFNTPIPLVDVSINDLLDFADTFSDALTEAQNNPAASLQLLDQTISEAFGVAAEPLVDLSGLTISKFDATHIVVSGDQTSKIFKDATVTVPIGASSEFVALVELVTFVGGQTSVQLDRAMSATVPAALTGLTVSDLKKDLIRFSLDNFDTDDNLEDDIIKIELNLGAAFSKSLTVRIPDLDLPGLGDAVDFGGAATLGAEGSASFSLDIGIGLNHPSNFYLYDSSGLHGELALTGTDMAFKAGLGPLSLSIIDGQASIEGTVDVSFDPDLFTDGRKLVDDDVDVGELVEGLDVEFAAPIDVTLPIYFPTESHGVGDITLAGDLADIGNGLFLKEDATAAPDDTIVLDVSEVLESLVDLSSGLTELSLLDQILFIVDGVDAVLGGVQDVMDGEVLGFSMPLIGDKLAGAADVVGDFRTGFLNDFRNEVEKLADPNENFVKDILFKLLGNSGFLIAVDEDGIAEKGR